MIPIHFLRAYDVALYTAAINFYPPPASLFLPARNKRRGGSYNSCRKPNAKAKRRAQKQGRKASR